MVGTVVGCAALVAVGLRNVVFDAVAFGTVMFGIVVFGTVVLQRVKCAVLFGTTAETTLRMLEKSCTCNTCM